MCLGKKSAFIHIQSHSFKSLDMHDVLNCNNNQSSTHPLWNRFPIGRQVLLKIKPGKNTSQRTGGKGNSDNCENFGCWPTKMRSMYFLLPEVISLSLTPGFIFSFRKSRKSLKESEGNILYTNLWQRGHQETKI